MRIPTRCTGTWSDVGHKLRMQWGLRGWLGCKWKRSLIWGWWSNDAMMTITKTTTDGQKEEADRSGWNLERDGDEWAAVWWVHKTRHFPFNYSDAANPFLNTINHHWTGDLSLTLFGNYWGSPRTHTASFALIWSCWTGIWYLGLIALNWMMGWAADESSLLVWLLPCQCVPGLLYGVDSLFMGLQAAAGRELVERLSSRAEEVQHHLNFIRIFPMTVLINWGATKEDGMSHNFHSCRLGFILKFIKVPYKDMLVHVFWL